VETLDDVTLGDAFWCTVAVNFSTSCVGLVVVMTGHWDLGFRIPLATMALSGLVALASLLPGRTRWIGVGGLLGVLVSVLGFVAVLTGSSSATSSSATTNCRRRTLMPADMAR
jgi:hypothetical protein